MARRTKEDALATRASLLDAAERLFAVKGVSRTSLADIASAAGTTRGAIYWHFKDKGDLFNAMLDRVTSPIEQALNEPIAEGGDPVAHLRQTSLLAMRMMEHCEQTYCVIRIATLMVEHVPEMTKVRDRHIESHTAHFVRVRQLLAQACVQRGVTLSRPIDPLARGFVALVHGMLTDWLLDSEFPLEATCADAMDAYFEGIGLPVQQAA